MKKVAIVGLHPSADDVEIPPDYEVWTLNDGWKSRKTYDRLYELHRLEERPWRPEGHLEELEHSTGEVWTFFPGLIKGAELYPLAEILGKYPPYFTTTPAWMVAHALYEKATHLLLLGLHFDTPKERLLEVPCMAFWIGYAKGLGVEVTLPPASPLLKGRGLYGLEDSLHNVYRELRDFTYQVDYGNSIDGFINSGIYDG